MKKITLNKETVRLLDEPNLESVLGGYPIFTLEFICTTMFTYMWLCTKTIGPQCKPPGEPIP